MDRDVRVALDELAKSAKKKRSKNRKEDPRAGGEDSPFMSLKQVLAIVPISKSAIYLLIKDGEFPAQIKLGKRSAVWSKKEVGDWVNEKLGI